MARLLDKQQTYERLNIGRSKFDQMVRDGVFPDAQYLPACTKKLWLDSTVDEWIVQNLSNNHAENGSGEAA